MEGAKWFENTTHLRVTGFRGESRMDFERSTLWEHLHTELKRESFVVSDVPFGQDFIDALVCFNHSPLAVLEAERCGVPIAKRVLILWEPCVTSPWQYQRRTYNKYGTILVPSVSRARVIDHPNVKAFRFPPSFVKPRLIPLEAFAARPNSGGIVQANKYSAVSGERYSLRRRVIGLAQSQDLPLRVFGRNWNRGVLFDARLWATSAVLTMWSGQLPSVKSVHGAGLRIRDYSNFVENLSAALAQFRVSVVIENSSDYISEKLTQAVAGGSIAIYVGPSPEEANLPVDICFWVSPSAEEIVASLRTILAMNTDEQYALMQRQVNALMKSGEHAGGRAAMSELGLLISRVLSQ